MPAFWVSRVGVSCLMSAVALSHGLCVGGGGEGGVPRLPSLVRHLFFHRFGFSDTDGS